MFGTRQRGKLIVGVVAVTALGMAGCGSSSKSASSTTTAGTSASATTATGSTKNTASDVGVTATTIKIGYITALTGNASSTFSDGPAGAGARIAAQNAAGGIDGRKIQLVSLDDQSTPAGDATASQDMASQKGVLGVIDFSPYTFGGARALQAAGIPVTGDAFDGPEWGQEPYSNMFTYTPPTYTPFNGLFYSWGYMAKFLQQIGVTKLAGLAYGISSSSQSSIKVIYSSGAPYGISNCYANYSVPFGGADFTAAALAITSKGCNGVVGSFVDASDVSLSTALKQGGSTAKQLYYTGYDQNTLSSSAAKAAFDGDYFFSSVLFDPSAIPAVSTMFDNLQKYDPSYKAGSLPDMGLYGSYIAADLMIKGLEGAGQNPTRKSFISNLRQVTAYDAGGLLPAPTSFANFGTSQMIPQTGCAYFVQLKNGQFMNAVANGKPICATRISFKG